MKYDKSETVNGTQNSIKNVRCTDKSTDGAGNEKSEKAAQNSKVSNNSVGTKKIKGRKQKKRPLWLVIARAIYLFFEKTGRILKKVGLWFAGSIKKLGAWIFEFFVGLPSGVSYLFRKARKQLKSARKKRKKRKLQKSEEKKEEKKEHRILWKENAEERSENIGRPDRKYKNINLKAVFWSAIPTKVRSILPFVIAGVLLFYEFLMFAGIGVFCLRDGFVLPKKSITMTTEIEGSIKRNTISASNAYSGEGKNLYFSMTVLADRLNLSTVSDNCTVFYTLSGGQTAKMTKDSCTVTLNGGTITLSSPVRFVKERVYVPVELLTLYTEGLNVTFGNNVLTIVQETDQELSTPQKTVYKEFRFIVSGIRPADVPSITEKQV